MTGFASKRQSSNREGVEMGKRSDFERKKLDYYPTPLAAFVPLIPHLPRSGTFCEPCAGAGVLIDHIERHTDLRCVSAFDVEPRRADIRVGDASWALPEDMWEADFCITNPPWDRPVLHQIIERLPSLKPTWLLFDADWMHTRQASRYLEICHKVVAIGRVKWIEDSDMAGKDNACWYFFDASFTGPTTFVGRP